MTRALAALAGCIILGASAFATIQHTGADEAQQALIWAAAGGLVIGAAIVSHAPGALRWVIVAFLACGELYGALSSFERVVETREAKAAVGRAQALAIDKAKTRLADASADLAKAKQAVADKAPLKDCKVNCRELLQAAVDASTADRDAARAALDALPVPEASDVFAAQTGFAAWKISMALALLLSLATNGLGAALVAYAAHVPTVAPSAPVLDMQPLVPRIIVADTPGPNGPTVRPGRTEKQQALSDLLNRLGRGEPVPSQDFLAAEWGRPKQTVSDWLREWRRIGVIPSETRIGRCKATVAA